MYSPLEERKTLSIDQRKEVFATELLKTGIEPQTAVEVAEIVANELPDEQLTSEQIQLVRATFAKWLEGRKRQQFIDEAIQRFEFKRQAIGKSAKSRILP